METIARIPYCFTLQCCYGHFLCGSQQDRENLDRLRPSDSEAPVEYRIAYVALCVDNCNDGVSLLDDLQKLTSIDPEYVQFGCAEWFWERQVNSYALQVEPERFKDRDSARINYEEALHTQRVRDVWIKQIGEMLERRIRSS